MNDNFERDPRRKQELLGRPIADQIYANLWSCDAEGIHIKRYEKEEKLLLDLEFAIDVTITLPNGMKLNGQEKFLSYQYAWYNSLTVEYMQNPLTLEKGDWFKLAPQFYMSSYFNEDKTDFLKYVIIDWPALVILSNYNKLKWQENKNKDGRAKASFRYIDFNDIPDECIIQKKL